MSGYVMPRRRELVLKAAGLSDHNWCDLEWCFDTLSLGDAALESLIAEPDVKQRIAATYDLANERWLKRRDETVSKAVRKRLLEMLGPTGPTALLGVDLDKLPAALRSLAERYEPQRDGGRVLAGPTGLGKTLGVLRAMERLMLAEARGGAPEDRNSDIANAARRAVWGYRWVRALDLAAARAQHPLGQGEPPFLTEAVNARELLVIDDLGQEPPSRIDDLFAVVDARYAAGRITCVTTGLEPGNAPNQLQGRYGSAFVRRVQDAGGRPGKVLSLFGKGTK